MGGKGVIQRGGIGEGVGVRGMVHHHMGMVKGIRGMAQLLGMGRVSELMRGDWLHQTEMVRLVVGVDVGGRWVLVIWSIGLGHRHWRTRQHR